jgi:hypothetical protein
MKGIDIVFITLVFLQTLAETIWKIIRKILPWLFVIGIVYLGVRGCRIHASHQFYMVYIGVWNLEDAKRIQSDLRKKGYTVEIEKRDWE